MHVLAWRSLGRFHLIFASFRTCSTSCWWMNGGHWMPFLAYYGHKTLETSFQNPAQTFNLPLSGTVSLAGVLRLLTWPCPLTPLHWMMKLLGPFSRFSPLTPPWQAWSCLKVLRWPIGFPRPLAKRPLTLLWILLKEQIQALRGNTSLASVK